MKLRATLKQKSEFNEDSMTEEDLGDGVKAVKGKIGDSEDLTIQSLSFENHDEESAKKWMADNGIEGELDEEEDEEDPTEADQKKVEDEESYNLNGVEIMRTGTWNNTTFTSADLDSMVESFNETKAELKPYLKLGHNEEQALLASDGLPAAGWITSLKREGNRVLADIKNIPKKIYELIEKKRYGRFSAEIYFDAKVKEKFHRRALKAVALLGSDTPAVSSMEDLINIYKKDENVQHSQLFIAEDFKGDDMINEQLKAENKELRTRLEKLERDTRQGKVQSFIDAQIKAGKILPAQANLYTSLLMSEQVNKFSRMENENLVTEDLTNLQLFEKIMAEQPAVVDFSEQSVNHKPEPKSEDDLLHEKAVEYSEKHQVDYKMALEAVAQGEN